MKKRVLFMALTGLALSSCVSDQMENGAGVAGPVKLTFDSPVLMNNSGTRANYYGEVGSHTYDGSSTVYNYPKEEDFTIYAVQHDGDFAGWSAAQAHEINNTTVKYDQSVDGWAPKNSEDNYYYWPSGKMSFAATSPANLELSGVDRKYGANGLTITGFEVQSTADKHYDLLFSTRTINKTSADMLQGASYYSGIPIQFQHALSSVRFSIQNTTDADVVLKEIKVYGVKYKGDFAENLDENTSDYSQYVRGTNVNPAWDVKNDIIDEANGYVGFTGSVGFPISAQYVAALSAADTDAADENEESHQLLLMPQELTDDACVKVTYTVNGHQHSKVAKFNEWKDTSDNEVDEWQMGVRYTYRLVYSQGTADKDKIYFSPSTDQWVEHDIVVIEL